MEEILEQSKLICLQEIWMPYHGEKEMNEAFPEFTFQISTPDMFMKPKDRIIKPDHCWHGSAIGWPAPSTFSLLQYIRQTKGFLASW